MLAYLTNGKVAWQIPETAPLGVGDIARRYLEKTYVPPKGWKVIPTLPRNNLVTQGICGEWNIKEGK